MIVLKVCEESKQVELYWQEDDLATFVGLVDGLPYYIKAVGNMWLVSLSRDKQGTGWIWADKIQRGDR